MYAGNSISRTLNPGFRNQTDSDLDELALFPSEQAAVTPEDGRDEHSPGGLRNARRRLCVRAASCPLERQRRDVP